MSSLKCNQPQNDLFYLKEKIPLEINPKTVLVKLALALVDEQVCNTKFVDYKLDSSLCLRNRQNIRSIIDNLDEFANDSSEEVLRSPEEAQSIGRNFLLGSDWEEANNRSDYRKSESLPDHRGVPVRAFFAPCSPHYPVHRQLTTKVSS